MADEQVPGLWWSQVERFAAGLDDARIESAGVLDAGLRAQAGEIGVFAASIPTAHGGLGLGLRACCELVALLAEYDRSFATTVGLHTGLGSQALVRFGGDALRARWLPQMASGACIGSFAATEPCAGSDLMAVRTTAREVAGALEVSGDKSFVTNGAFAGVYTVLARTPGIGGRRAHHLVCVPRGVPGVEVGPEEHKLGLRASSTVAVHFDAARVGMESLLRGPGGGIGQAHEVLRWGRTLMAAGCVGTARTALERTRAQVNSRVQFRRPLSAFEAVQDQVAGMGAELYAMECLLRAAADSVGSVDSVAPVDPVDRGHDEAGLSVMAKVFCSEGAFGICDRALQLHGAQGFMEQVGIARLLRDCRVARIFEGANDVLLVQLGALLLASGAKAATAPSTACGDAALPVVLCRSEVARACNQIAARYGVGAVHRQLALQALSRAHIAVTTAELVDADARGRGQAQAALGALAVSGLLGRARAALAAVTAAPAQGECARAAFHALMAEGPDLPRPRPNTAARALACDSATRRAPPQGAQP